MAKRRRWVQFEVPLFVRVDIDDAYDIDGEATKVVLAIEPLDQDLTGPVSPARDPQGRPLVYDGDPGAGMALVDDEFASRAVGIAGFRAGWPARDRWEEDSDPRVEIGLYDNDDDALEELDETAF